MVRRPSQGMAGLIIRVAPDDFELLSVALKETSVDEVEIIPILACYWRMLLKAIGEC